MSEELVRQLLMQIGENPDREGLVDTPRRFMKAFTFWTAGYKQDPGEVLKTFADGANDYDEMVFQGSIAIHSLCEHHLTPFFGLAHVGYVPNKRIVGLSKLARLCDIYARRLQVQERLCGQIADALQEYLNPVGVGVVLECRHLCMESRGVQKIGTITVTSSLKGCLRDEEEARAEFFAMVGMARREVRMP